MVYETGPGRGTSAVAGEVATALPEHVERAVRGSWPAPDLALVRLREPVDHDCAYVTERPAAYYGEARVFYSGWSVVGGELTRLNGTCTVQGTLGGWSADEQIRLGGDALPPGVSGGPVVDPVSGAVVGVLKSQADRGLGGTSTGVEQLRSLTVPTGEVRAEHDDVYQAVFHAHDRHHRDRQRHPQRHPDNDGSTWADIQNQLGARPGRDPPLGPARLARDRLGALAAPLTEAFRECDEPGQPAVLHVALPHPLLELDVDTWKLGPDEAPHGARRPVVVRCADPDHLPDADDPSLPGGRQVPAHEEYDGREGRSPGLRGQVTHTRATHWATARPVAQNGSGALPLRRPALRGRPGGARTDRAQRLQRRAAKPETF
ncbi:VMAP-C domain-containing protein [Streptomyces sp. NPDC005046]